MRIVLVTTRSSKRWIIPRGQVDMDLTFDKIAALEAFEEAGVRGKINGESYHEYDTMRDGWKVRYRIYPMKVKEILDEWPEKESRDRKIVAPDKALKLIDDDSLCECLERILAGIKKPRF